MACLSRDGAEFTQGWCDPTVAARLPSPATSGPFRRPLIHVWAAPRGIWATMVGGLLAARRAGLREVCWSLWREAGGALHRELGHLIVPFGPLWLRLARRAPCLAKGSPLVSMERVRWGAPLGVRPSHSAFWVLWWRLACRALCLAKGSLLVSMERGRWGAPSGVGRLMGLLGPLCGGLLALLQSAGMQRWSLRSRGY